MSCKKGEQIERGIWRRDSGKGYVVDVSVRDPKTGERIRKRNTTIRLDDARDWRDSVKVDALRDEIRKREKIKRITFSDFAAEYLKVWAPKCKPTTVAREKVLIEGVLKPCFGSRLLHTITRRDIEIHIAGRRSGEIVIRRKEGIKASSANRELCRLKNMLQMAEDWGYITQNPARRIKQEREYPQEADYLTVDEIPKVVSACPPWLRPIVVVAVHSGMRWGELMALRWRDVDLKQRQITVGDSKNHDVRYVPMDDTLIEALSQHRREDVRKSGGIAQRVFTNPRTGSAYHHCSRAFKEASKNAIGRALTFHCTRHTAASHLVMAALT
jgi:integrase